MTRAKPCPVCPRRLNLEKQLALAVNELRNIDSPEARLVLKHIATLSVLPEPELCHLGDVHEH